MSTGAASVSVLLVEDEVLISNLVADWLSERGFAVTEVTTAGDALDYLSSGAPVDVLFTDVDLPGGMDGAELASRVRAERPDLPIVYASGRFNPGEVSGGMVPRSMFLPKPYSREDVCRLLDRVTAPTERCRRSA